MDFIFARNIQNTISIQIVEEKNSKHVYKWFLNCRVCQVSFEDLANTNCWAPTVSFKSVADFLSSRKHSLGTTPRGVRLPFVTGWKLCARTWADFRLCSALRLCVMLQKWLHLLGLCYPDLQSRGERNLHCRTFWERNEIINASAF